MGWRKRQSAHRDPRLAGVDFRRMQREGKGPAFAVDLAQSQAGEPARKMRRHPAPDTATFMPNVCAGAVGNSSMVRPEGAASDDLMPACGDAPHEDRMRLATAE